MIQMTDGTICVGDYSDFCRIDNRTDYQKALDELNEEFPGERRTDNTITREELPF
jgi:hypothetical protein